MLEELLAAATRRGIRRLADQDRRRPVRQRLCRREPQFQDSGADGPQRAGPIRVFESGAILLHLAEKFGAFLPTERPARAECLSWLFWQMGSAPYLGGGFGHFYAYAPTKIEYAIDRFAMEVKRQLDVLDRRLADNEYLAGDDYTIADIAVWPWYGGLAKGLLYGGGEFLQVQDYKNVQRWTDAIAERPAVNAAAWSTAPGANPRASCTNATTPATSRPGHRTRSASPPRRSFVGGWPAEGMIRIQCATLTPAFAPPRLRRRKHDPVVGPAVAVREHAADRMIALHMHAHGLAIPQFVANMEVDAFAHDQYAFADLDGFPGRALHRPGCGGQSRRLDLCRRRQFQSEKTRFADVGRKVAAGFVHRLRQRLVRHVDHELAGARDVDRGVLAGRRDADWLRTCRAAGPRRTR